MILTLSSGKGKIKNKNDFYHDLVCIHVNEKYGPKKEWNEEDRLNIEEGGWVISICRVPA